jgi:hypothetical protein
MFCVIPLRWDRVCKYRLKLLVAEGFLMVGWVTAGKVSGMDEREVLQEIVAGLNKFMGGIANCDTIKQNLSYGKE